MAAGVLVWGKVDWKSIVQNEPQPVIGLSYRTHGTPGQNRLAKWFMRLPYWLIAIILLAPVFVFDIFSLDRIFPEQLQDVIRQVLPFAYFAVWFIAGAVRRLAWRQIIFMLALAGAWYGLSEMFYRWPLFEFPFPYSLAIWKIAPVMMVGIGEWILMRPRSQHSLIWILILSTAVGCLTPLIYKPLDWTGASMSFQFFSRGYRNSWGGIVYWPLLVILTWIAIPAAMHLGQSTRRSLRFAAVGATVSVIAAFLLFFNVVMFQLAHRSLIVGSPFTRDWGAAILEERFSAADQQALWNSLQQSDWTKAEDYSNEDYRRRCIKILAKRDPSGTAKCLAEMLRDKPSETLATFSAPLLGQQRRYDAAPILMRFALLGNPKSLEALETMGVPQAALAIIRNISIYDRPNSMIADFAIPPDARQRLARLLGKDVGPNFRAWTSNYDATDGNHPTPLPKEVTADIARVANAMASYWAATQRLYEAKSRLFIRRLEEDGKGKYMSQMRSLEPLMKKQGRFTDSDVAQMNPTMISDLDRYQTIAFRDMAVSLPNWNVPGTSGLENEVASYAARVEEIVSRFHVEASPTTHPLNRK